MDLLLCLGIGGVIGITLLWAEESGLGWANTLLVTYVTMTFWLGVAYEYNLLKTLF